MKTRYALLLIPMLLLTLTSCQGVTDHFPGSDFFDGADPVEMTTVKQGRHAAGVLEAENRVIKTHDEFQAFWQELHQYYDPMPEVPEIDFTERMVLVTVMGGQPSGGFGTRIEKASVKDGVLGAHVVDAEAGENCVTTTEVTNPYHIVTVPRMEGPVKFYEQNVVSNCED